MVKTVNVYVSFGKCRVYFITALFFTESVFLKAISMISFRDICIWICIIMHTMLNTRKTRALTDRSHFYFPATHPRPLVAGNGHALSAPSGEERELGHPSSRALNPVSSGRPGAKRSDPPSALRALRALDPGPAARPLPPPPRRSAAPEAAPAPLRDPITHASRCRPPRPL